MIKSLLNRVIFILAIVLGTGVTLHAQSYPQLVNGNMELWDNAGNSSQEPQQWNSFMTAQCDLGAFLCGFAVSQQMARSTDVRPGSSGIYSARIYSKEPISGTIANGNMTTGIIRMGSSTPTNSANYNYTKRADANHRMPLNEVPDSLVFWAKYQPGNNSTTNTARVNAVIHNNNDYQDPNGNASQEVAAATLNYTRTHDGSNYIWKRFSVPFVPTNNGATPSYILITFTTNNIAGGGANNDQVWIDDVELIYNPKLNMGTINPLAYYVSPIQNANVSVPFTLSGPAGSIGAGNVVTAQLSDATGSFASPINIGTLATTTSGTINATIPAGTPAGTGYRIRVVSSNPVINSADNGADITIQTISQNVTPSSSQSILLSQNGNALTVNESPASTSREWKYSTTAGGPYLSFSPAETGSTYTPNFNTVGTYYIVCESQILTQTYTSNEVVVNVNNISINTGTIIGSPFEFSASAPNASVNVPFTVLGGSLNSANVFTAELSDASGSFASPVVIGTLAGTTDGTIIGTIPYTTAGGTAYRIRVVSSDFPIVGGDNGTDLIVDQFSNSITPAATQQTEVNLNGNVLTVSESQNATRQWQFATVSGGPYSDFSPMESGPTYTPFFTNVGTYYVVCRSINGYGDDVLSNEVQIDVLNGTTIRTTQLLDSVFYISPNAVINADVHFMSNAVFQPGNTFTVEMSDENGSFAAATVVGSVTATTPAPITVTIPNTLVNSGSYKFRVLSSDPVIVGQEGFNTGEVVNHAVVASPTSPQFLFAGAQGTPVTAYPAHINVDFYWGVDNGSGFVPFSPAETNATYTPLFANPGTYDVTCAVVNMWNDTVFTPIFKVTVESVGLPNADLGQILLFNQNEKWSVHFAESVFKNPNIALIDMQGRTLWQSHVSSGSMMDVYKPLQSGVYILRLTENGHVYQMKVVHAH